MGGEIRYDKITVAADMDPDEGLIYVDGGLKWNPFWVEKLNDYKKYFIDLLQAKILEAIGEGGWAVLFKQISPATLHFVVNIYVDNNENYPRIVGIVKDKVPKEFNLDFSLKGNIQAYLIKP